MNHYIIFILIVSVTLVEQDLTQAYNRKYQSY